MLDEHDGPRRTLPHALGAPRRVEPEVAGRDRDDAAEHERLEEPLDEIVGDEAEGEAARGDLLPHRAPVDARRHADHERGDQVAADDPDEVVDDGEHRQHDQRREHARRDELLDRVRAERVEGVDLLGDAHRAELRGDAGADAAGDHQPGEHGTELADHRRRSRGGRCTSWRRTCASCTAGLEREHHPGEEAGEEDDAERLDPDLVHLLDEVLAVERAGEDEAQRLARPG